MKGSETYLKLAYNKKGKVLAQVTRELLDRAGHKHAWIQDFQQQNQVSLSPPLYVPPSLPPLP